MKMICFSIFVIFSFVLNAQYFNSGNAHVDAQMARQFENDTRNAWQFNRSNDPQIRFSLQRQLNEAEYMRVEAERRVGERMVNDTYEDVQSVSQDSNYYQVLNNNNRYVPFNYDKGLTPEQWKMLEEGREEHYERSVRDPETVAYWLYRTGPDLVRKLSLAMSDDDVALAKQIHYEIENFFKSHRYVIERDYTGKPVGRVTKAIFEFAKAGLNGLLWSNTKIGPRVVRATTCVGNENSSVILSYDDFMYEHSPQKLESLARKYRKLFQIASNEQTRDTADYIMADKNHPMHRLYARLLNLYNIYKESATNNNNTGSRRAQAQDEVNEIATFISVLAPVQHKYHSEFYNDSIRESVFWEYYYEFFRKSACEKHMEDIVKKYLAEYRRDGELINLYDWFLKISKK